MTDDFVPVDVPRNPEAVSSDRTLFLDGELISDAGHEGEKRFYHVGLRRDPDPVLCTTCGLAPCPSGHHSRLQGG